ncbi:MAG TPA: CopD family protein [Pyrinomonadaceae bacterium]
MILRNQRKRRFATVGRALVILLMTIVPSTALAHTKLVRSQPKANEVLSQTPKLIELWFTEELEPGLTSIDVSDEQSNRVDKGSVALSEGNKKATIELGELRPGVYTVAWKTVSADQHVIRDRFAFSVEASSAGVTSSTPGPFGTPEHGVPTGETVSEQEQGEQVSSDQILVRWLSYLAMMTLFGGFAFRSFVLVPSLRYSHDGPNQVTARTATEARVLVLLWLSIALLALTTLVALIQQASAVFDKSFVQSLSPSLWVQTLRTGYGASWILQIASLVVLGMILFLLKRQVKRYPAKEHSVFWWLGLVASAGLLVAPSWTGHALASAKDFRLAVFADWLHLLAGGFWVGALFHLALVLPRALASVPKPRRAIAVHQFITRFTRVAIPSVVLLVLAGLYNAWTHIPGLRAIWTTPYGKTLALKLFVVGVMLLLGALNNFHFGKRAARLVDAQKTNSDVTSLARLERSFRRSVTLEAGLGVVVLVVTAVLVFLTPARSHPAMTSNDTEPGVVWDKR